MHHLRVSDDEDLDRLRTFSASKGGKWQLQTEMKFRQIRETNQYFYECEYMKLKTKTQKNFCIH